LKSFRKNFKILAEKTRKSHFHRNPNLSALKLMVVMSPLHLVGSSARLVKQIRIWGKKESFQAAQAGFTKGNPNLFA